jgi:Protein of unknown function (DUF559)
VSDARAQGLQWRNLQTRNWRRLSRGQYAWSGQRPDLELTLRAAAKRMPSGFAFSGSTAAWILGLDMPPAEPIEITVARDIPVRARAGVRLRRASLPDGDVITFRGFTVTSPLRTVRDLGSRADLVESVVAVEMALRAGLVDLPSLRRDAESRPGAKGIRRMRRALVSADPRSESPMETRLRMDIITAGLPTPCVQAELNDDAGRFIARVDLYYPDVRQALEFDGQNHRDRLVGDARRQNELVNARYQVLRFTAADLRVRGSAANLVRKARDRLRQDRR